MKGNKFVETLKNRQVLAPLSLHFSRQGSLSKDEAHFILNQSQDCGIILLGSHAIDEQYLAYEAGWVLQQTLNSQSFSYLQDVCRDRKVPLGIQLYANVSVEQIQQWTDNDFAELLQQFANSIQLCAEKGIDIIEIHGANSFVLHKLLSPIYNNRTDKWSATSYLFLRMLMRVIDEMKRLYPSIQCGIRLVPEEMTPGYTFSDFENIIEIINQSKICYLHLSTRCWNQVNATGNLIIDITKKRLNQNILLIGSGGVFNESEADECLQFADLVSIGKPLLFPIIKTTEHPVSSQFLETIKQQVNNDNPNFLGYCLKKAPMIAGPMSTMSSLEDGNFSFDEKQLYTRIAQQANIVIIGATGISTQSASVPHGNRLASQVNMYSHRSLVNIMHKFQTKHAIVQLYHGGEYAEGLIADEKNALKQLSSNVYSKEEMSELIFQVFQQFRKATSYAVQAGFSGIELNLSDPYLLCQWCFSKESASIKRKLIRYLILVLKEEINQHLGKQVLLGVRFSVTDLAQYFIQDNDFADFLTTLANNVDYISINSADYRTVASQWVIEKIQRCTKGKIPLLFAGRIRTQQDVERLASKGVFAVMVRPFIFSELIKDCQFNSATGYKIKKENITNIRGLNLPKGLQRTIQENIDWYVE